MLQYFETEIGYYTIGDSVIPNSPTNRDYILMQVEIREELAEVVPYVKGTTPYRDLRQIRYISELSPEGTFEKTVGDMMDALVKAHYGDSSELDIIATIIQAIKADIPEDGI